MNSVFAESLKHVDNDELFMYTNSDIVYFDSLLAGIERAVIYNNYLLIGQRLDYNLSRQIDFSDGELLSSLECLVRSKGTMHGKWGLDYFVFQKKNWIKLPPYLAGNWRWDNHIALAFLQTPGAMLVDGTQIITALHQTTKDASLALEARAGAIRNEKLVRASVGKRYFLGNTEQADVLLKAEDSFISGSLEICSRNCMHGLVRCVLENSKNYSTTYVQIRFSFGSVKWTKQFSVLRPARIYHVQLQGGEKCTCTDYQPKHSVNIHHEIAGEVMNSNAAWLTQLVGLLVRAGYDVALEDAERWFSLAQRFPVVFMNNQFERNVWRSIERCVEEETSLILERVATTRIIGTEFRLGSLTACVQKGAMRPRKNIGRASELSQLPIVVILFFVWRLMRRMRNGLRRRGNCITAARFLGIKNMRRMFVPWYKHYK